jgi:hypothetical protein
MPPMGDASHPLGGKGTIPKTLRDSMCCVYYSTGTYQTQNIDIILGKSIVDSQKYRNFATKSCIITIRR